MKTLLGPYSTSEMRFSHLPQETSHVWTGQNLSDGKHPVRECYVRDLWFDIEQTDSKVVRHQFSHKRAILLRFFFHE